MAYEVTATRKRPQVFEKLVGQEFVASTLEHAIEQKRIAHAYLFSGPRGVGKTTSARLLAKSLNCEHGPTAHPCGECNSCVEITNGNSIDVIEIDGASNTSVNDIRAIKDEVLFPPQCSRYKIYIIDEVHMLSNSAFNALLKTIEEPPEYIIFIFATTELQKVPATIRSRCQQFHFQLINLESIKACLAEAANEMKVEADDDALFWIAKEATGSMRDAYTLFDQVVAFSENHITLEKIKNKLGLVGIENITNIVRLALQNNQAALMEALNDLFAKGTSVEQFIRDYIDFFRTLLLRKEGITAEDILSHRPEQVPTDLVETFSSEQLETVLRSLFNMYRDIRYSINPRFELELFTLRLARLPYLTTGEALVKQLAEMKADILQGKTVIVKEQKILPVQVQTVKKEVVEGTKQEPIKEAIVEKKTISPEEIDNDEQEEHVDDNNVAPVLQPKESVKSNIHDFSKEDFIALKACPNCDINLTLALPYLTSFKFEAEKNSLTLLCENALMLNSLLEKKSDIVKEVNLLCGFTGKLLIERQIAKDTKDDIPRDAQILVNRFSGTFIPPKTNTKKEN